MHSKVQVLLTREDLHLSKEAEALVQLVYQGSQELQNLIKDKLPPASG